jgi:hypothetical protein
MSANRVVLHCCSPVLAPALALAFSTIAGASEAQLAANPGATAGVTVDVSVSILLGTDSDSDSVTVAADGTATLLLYPAAPPFTDAQLQQLELSFAPASLSFQLCYPLVGCQSLSATVSDLTFSLTEPINSSIDAGTGAVSFADAQIRATGSYVTSGVATASGTFDEIAPADFTGVIAKSAPGTITLDQLAIDDQVVDVPPEDLPPGVNAISFTVVADLSGMTFSGRYGPRSADLDDDGEVGPSDLGALLASWGPCPDGPICAADLNADGSVGAADLGTLLATWG